MNIYQISLNQLMKFSKASEAGRKGIINLQLNPVIPKMFWYQKAKACMRKYYRTKGDSKIIKEGIEFLKNKDVSKPREITDRLLSIEVLERFLKIKYPQAMKNLKYELVKVQETFFVFGAVEIRVAPEVIFRGTLDNKKVVGAIKFHIAKSDIFSIQQAEEAALIVHKYVIEKVATKDETALRELCFCLDIFGGRIVAAPDQRQIAPKLKTLTTEIKSLWDKVLTVEINPINEDDSTLGTLLNLAIGKPKKQELVKSKDGGLILRFWPGKYWEAKAHLNKAHIGYQII